MKRASATETEDTGSISGWVKPKIVSCVTFSNDKGTGSVKPPTCVLRKVAAWRKPRGPFTRGVRRESPPRLGVFFFHYAAGWPVSTGRLAFSFPDRSPTLLVLVLALLLGGGNVQLSQLKLSPFRSTSCITGPEPLPLCYSCSICVREVGWDSLRYFSNCSMWVHFCSSLSRVDFRVICPALLPSNQSAPHSHPPAGLDYPHSPLFNTFPLSLPPTFVQQATTDSPTTSSPPPSQHTSHPFYSSLNP